MSEIAVRAEQPTLTFPDRYGTVPVGWAETFAVPAILAVDRWEDLDEYEASLKAMASWIDSHEGDSLEYEKALRIVEKRRGDLLGSDLHQGRPSARVREVDASPDTQGRWRAIAREWDRLWPLIRDAKSRRDVTQTAVLRAIAPTKLHVVREPGWPERAGEYAAIVADPPWQYDNRATRGAAEDHYGTMTLDELHAVPVGEWAAPQSHLYLWTTNGFLREAFTLLDAWGFTYKTTLVWVKPQMGMGNYFRSSTEYVLFGIKGGLGTLANNQMNWFNAPRGRHSQKPGCFFDLVEKSSPGPFLEMFARDRRMGDWDFWGNQA